MRGTSRQRETTPETFANHEIVAIAVYLLGGRTRPIDTEDIAVKANELAPGRFTWRKYRDQINLEIIRVYLSDAKKQSKGSYLNGTGTDGWLLTEAGLSFAKEHAGFLVPEDLAREVVDIREKRWRRSERTRLLSTDAFQKLTAGKLDTVSSAEAAAFFRVDEYVSVEMRKKKVTRLLNAFGDDPELGKAIRALAKLVGRSQ